MANFFEKLFGKKETTTADVYSLKISDLENCLLQQTTSYRRGYPIIFATNDEKELFLIYYFPNTFYIVKVAYENNKLNVVRDYRRNYPAFKGFQYKLNQDSLTAVLSLADAEVNFTVTPTLRYIGSGCAVMSDQTPLYEQFVGYVATYHKNINNTVAMMHQDSSYLDLLKAVAKMSDADKLSVKELLDAGDTLEAIRRIQRGTGLGLADCKKIAESPQTYF